MAMLYTTGIMGGRLPTRCAHPTLGRRRVSTYTVLGFVGYGVATVVGILLAAAWQFSLVERLLIALLPALAFLATVRIARLVVHEERIVFYQVAIAAVASVALASTIAGGQTARLVDVSVIGVAVFLVFGRLGCFSVACCHGRPARFGTTYGAAHVAAGLWSRYAGRPLWPVQLIESVATAALIAFALIAGWSEPGVPAEVITLGYALIRFALEEVRGDGTRPYVLGLSEARWCAVATTIACSAWRQDVWSFAAAALLVVAATLLIFDRRRRSLLDPGHLREIERASMTALRSGGREVTAAGIAVSCRPLPDGRFDCVLSSEHPAWSVEAATRLAGLLWSAPEVVPGQLPGLMHVILRPEERP
ncbi:MAG: prolipoprotein diacylglyceryl transferase [Deltaproteobacteria bacterium]|nr:prolipoprotein diacylglyceryl transferase [Deltaproteobacteria bacterium]